MLGRARTRCRCLTSKGSAVRVCLLRRVNSSSLGRPCGIVAGLATYVARNPSPSRRPRPEAAEAVRQVLGRPSVSTSSRWNSPIPPRMCTWSLLSLSHRRPRLGRPASGRMKWQPGAITRRPKSRRISDFGSTDLSLGHGKDEGEQSNDCPDETRYSANNPKYSRCFAFWSGHGRAV